MICQYTKDFRCINNDSSGFCSIEMANSDDESVNDFVNSLDQTIPDVEQSGLEFDDDVFADDGFTADEVVEPVLEKVEDFVKIIVATGSTKKEGTSNLVENLWNMVVCLAWNFVHTSKELRQSKQEDQWSAATLQLREIMRNLPTATYWQENLFVHFPQQKWPTAFLTFVDGKTETVPTEEFLKSYLARGVSAGTRDSQTQSQESSKTKKRTISKANFEEGWIPSNYIYPREHIQALWIGKIIQKTKSDIIGEINNHVNPLWRQMKSGEQVGSVLHEVLSRYFSSHSEKKAKDAFKTAKASASKPSATEQFRLSFEDPVQLFPSTATFLQ